MWDRKRILFLDADRAFRLRAVMRLRSAGFDENSYEIVELDSIETGYKAIERDRYFHAIVTAWKNPVRGLYPEFNGIELLRKMRSHDDPGIRAIPVVVMSVDHRGYRYLAGIEQSAFVPKDELEELSAELTRLIGRNT